MVIPLRHVQRVGSFVYFVAIIRLIVVQVRPPAYSAKALLLHEPVRVCV
jgi:hypothetical protein